MFTKVCNWPRKSFVCMLGDNEVKIDHQNISQTTDYTMLMAYEAQIKGFRVRVRVRFGQHLMVEVRLRGP